MSKFAIAQPEVTVVPVLNSDLTFPLRRIYCIGRNYAAHTIEMGGDPDREEPFFSRKMLKMPIPQVSFPIRLKAVMFIMKLKWLSPSRAAARISPLRMPLTTCTAMALALI